MKSVDLTVMTQQIRMAEIIMDVQDCSQVSPVAACTIFYELNHQGNMHDELMVELFQVNGISAQTSQQIWAVEIGESVRNLSLNLTSIAGAIAYSNYSLTLNLMTSDGLLLDSKNISGYIGPRIEWVFEYAASAVDEQGKLSMTMVIRNDGNTVDGLIVRLSSTHFTAMSFIPPEGAIFEGGEKIRSFEMTNISIGDNFTFRAWIILPNDQSNDGTLFANITVHSRLDDSNPLYFQAEADYLAAQKSAEDGLFTEVMEDAINTSVLFIKAWWYICFSIIIAGVMILKAARDRRSRMKDPMAVIFGTTIPENGEDDKEKTEEIIHQPTQTMNRDEFTQRFKSQSAIKTYETQTISEGVVRAAETIIDHHDENLMRQKLDDLTTQITAGVVQPHTANQVLDDYENAPPEEIPAVNDDDLDL